MGMAKIVPAKPDVLFLPYQERWILDDSRIKLVEKSRQIGFSWASAYEAVRKQSQSNATLDEWISSRDEIQARLFLDDCKKFAGVLNIAAEDMGRSVLDEKGTSNFVLKFANGVKINSMSSSPDAQAGKRGGRLLDEFALHKDNRKLYAIAYPGITWGGCMRIVSTHRGSHNFFNKLIVEAREKGNPKQISLHRVTLEDALNEGFLWKLQSKLASNDPRQEMDESDYFNYIKDGCADEESFLQEYMCVPADDASAFLSYELITACEYNGNPELLSQTNDFADLRDFKSLYVGVDIGRNHDLTVIWVNSYEAQRHWCRRLIAFKNKTFSEQEEILYRILALPNMRRCCIDSTGLGMQFAERAIEKFGSYRVEGVKFSAAVKEDLAYPLRSAFEDLNIKIPEDAKLRADLRAIRKETTLAGNVRFSADRGENGHSDRFWAVALALHAAKNSDTACGMEALNNDSYSGNNSYYRPDNSDDEE